MKRNATDGEILRFADKYSLTTYHRALIRFGLAQEGLRATTDRICRVLVAERLREVRGDA